jgi:hypothetical protein
MKRSALAIALLAPIALLTAQAGAAVTDDAKSAELTMTCVTASGEDEEEDYVVQFNKKEKTLFLIEEGWRVGYRVTHVKELALLPAHFSSLEPVKETPLLIVSGKTDEDTPFRAFFAPMMMMEYGRLDEPQKQDKCR